MLRKNRKLASSARARACVFLENSVFRYPVKSQKKIPETRFFEETGFLEQSGQTAQIPPISVSNDKLKKEPCILSFFPLAAGLRRNLNWRYIEGRWF